MSTASSGVASPRVAHWAVAAFSVVVAGAVTTALWPLVNPTATPLFFAAVVVSSWYGGRGPGLLATALSVALTEVYFYPPLWSLSAATAIRVAAFVFVAILVASLYDRARTAQMRAEELARSREELLRQEQSARADAETASRAKDEFLATLSHELRTPLNAMVGWTWWLRQGSLDADRSARALETIDRNCKALAQLIEDLLDVSRIITGKLRLDMSAVALAPIVEASIEAVRPAVAAKAIELDVTLDRDLPRIAGDPDRLQQVMWNLLSNAIKFTPEKGHVSVRLERVVEGATITVADTGSGITADALPFIFDRFRQSETARAATRGLGLGLSIVRHLVEGHGGTIRAMSPGPGLGSTFIVTLPLRDPAELPDVADDTAATVTVVPANGVALDGVQILVVDDDIELRMLLAGALEGIGANVMQAGTVREALDVFTRQVPDVVVSDIRLPDDDGYTLIRRVRALPSERGGRTPAIALTAYSRIEDRSRALQAGFQMHVPKPVEPAELAAVVATLMGRTAGV